MAPDATVQVRRIVQLHARADDALASYALLHCVSRACSPLEHVYTACTCLATQCTALDRASYVCWQVLRQRWCMLAPRAGAAGRVVASAPASAP